MRSVPWSTTMTDLSEVCKRRRYDGPTPCEYPRCDCVLRPKVPWYVFIFNPLTLALAVFGAVIWIGSH